jgi:predicted nucleic acid-binding protein
VPTEHGLDQIIEEKKFHPITLIRKLDRKIAEKLGNKGIVILQQLTENTISELSKKTGINNDRLKELAQRAKEILSYSTREY